MKNAVRSSSQKRNAKLQVELGSQITGQIDPQAPEIPFRI